MTPTADDIRALADRIAAEFRPQKIILFGSRATGKAGPDSDVDLLVIMHFQGSLLDATVQMLDRVKPQFPVDLLIRSPEEAVWRYEGGDAIVRSAVDHGVILYEAAA